MTEHDLTESQLVGSRIRDARINRRMSQADLAAKANISLPPCQQYRKRQDEHEVGNLYPNHRSPCKCLLIPFFGPMCRR